EDLRERDGGVVPRQLRSDRGDAGAHGLRATGGAVAHRSKLGGLGVTSLRPQIGRYIRALKERDDHPDERQDLGTFLTWLLRRYGYSIRLAPLHYEGPKRRVSKGRYQQGIDLVASCPSEGENEAEDLFLFVLKPGNVGRAQWRNPEGIIGDLQELGYTS